MNTMNRRMEIINILIIRRHITTNELAQELGVSTRTIQYDIQALSPDYPSGLNFCFCHKDFFPKKHCKRRPRKNLAYCKKLFYDFFCPAPACISASPG